MKFTGQELEQLQQALLNAFNLDTLRQMLRFKLEKELDAITTANGFNNIVFDLITVASKEGWLIQLIIVAKDYNPNNKTLNAVATTLLNKSKTTSNQLNKESLVSTAPKRDNVIDQNYLDKQIIPEITFNKPKIIDIGVNELKALIPRVEILLLTVNDWERKALLSEMTAIDGKDGILQGALDRLTYRIGMFGNYCAAYTESTMSSSGRHGATLIAKIAVDELKPKAVLLLGIAFGIDSNKQKLGDVLIAESIQSYEFQKVNNDFSITYRGQATPCGNILSERFRMRRSDWTPKHGDKFFDDLNVTVYQGLVLSGDKLVNNKDFRDALVKAFPTAIGGEMEGAGAYSAVSSPVEVILIKSICDWADGDKNDKAQPFAAFTAVSLAKHVLSKPDVLHPLINTDYQSLKNSQNNQTHQPYQNPPDKTNASINQVVEAKHNSSISGVIQVSGSINNSTINIHSQPSKTSNATNSNQSNSSLLSTLEARKQDLIDDISAAYRQLGTSLNEVDKTRINRLIASLESELAEIQSKIDSSSTSANPVNNPVFSPKHNLPERNRFFTGRKDILSKLNRLLKSNKEVAMKLAISGLPGIGKTQTVIEFCYRNINNYQAIFWVKAENENDLNNSYLEIAILLKLIDVTNSNDLKNNDIVALIKNWLSTNFNWLMILDNLEDTNLSQKYLSNNHQSHILITTRSQTLQNCAEIVTLKKMSLDNNALFLLKRAKLYPIQTRRLGKISKKDMSIIQEIVNEMDGLPLALEQVAIYVQETQCSFSDYLAAYKDARNTTTILDHLGEDPNGHKSVFATFKLVFSKVEEKNSVAANFLQICSFLSPELIPKEISTNLGDLLGNQFNELNYNPLKFDKIIKTLLNYSLVERDTKNESLSIHRLVQTVIKQLIDDGTKRNYFEKLITALNDLCPEDPKDPKNWSKYRRLLPTASALLENDVTFKFLVQKSAMLFNRFGLYADTQALFAQALAFYFRSLHINKHHFGDINLDVAKNLNNIGEVYRQQSNYPLALDFYNQSLTIKKDLFGNNDISLAFTLNNIAIVYYLQSNYPLALDFYNQSLAIKIDHFGNNHPDVARTLNNIGEVYCQQGNYYKALDFHNQALTIRKDCFKTDPDHPDVAESLYGLATVYAFISKEEQALNHYKQVLDIYDKVFYPNHPRIYQLLNTYSQLLLKLNRTDEAQPLLDRLACLKQSP